MSAIARAAASAEADLRDAAEHFAVVPRLMLDLQGALSTGESEREIDGDAARGILADLAAAVRAMHDRAQDARKTLDAAARQLATGARSSASAEPSGDLAGPPPPPADDEPASVAAALRRAHAALGADAFDPALDALTAYQAGDVDGLFGVVQTMGKLMGRARQSVIRAMLDMGYEPEGYREADHA